MRKSRLTLSKAFLLLAAIMMVLVGCSGGDETASGNSVQLLNVSYDPTRELYKEYNKAFADYWQKEKNQKVDIKQSHGGSGKQARAVVDGVKADVVTLALGYDIDVIAERGLLKKDWATAYENNSTPYYSTIVFVVRKGNPKQIKDWNDLVKPGVEVITPNPKTSGGARWNYLAAYGYAMKTFNNDEQKAQQFVKDVYRNVKSLDSGARGSTTTFAQNKIGDVFISWENEALMIVKEYPSEQYQVVYPSVSVMAEPPVAIVDKNVDKKGSREVADAYLKYLYSDIGQEIIAKNYYRPRAQSVMDRYKDKFPLIEMMPITEFGGWQAAQEKHFGDDGIFDKIYEN